MKIKIKNPLIFATVLSGMKKGIGGGGQRTVTDGVDEKHADEKHGFGGEQKQYPVIRRKKKNKLNGGRARESRAEREENKNGI